MMHGQANTSIKPTYYRRTKRRISVRQMADHELFGLNSVAGRRIQTSVMFNV